LLHRQGYRVTVFHQAAQAREGQQTAIPDLIILDIALGDDGEAGFDLCRELRSHNPTLPIVFLSARDTEIDIVSGLRLGADDYLTKDISQPQLLARITALLRRVAALSSPERSEQVLKRDALELNIERLTVKWQDRVVELTYTEFWMLHALAKHPGHIKSRTQLMDAANVVLDDSTITSHIRRIRRKFEELDTQFSQIETAYGLGYRWKATA
jgi:two-component system OmpR family response regulator